MTFNPSKGQSVAGTPESHFSHPQPTLPKPLPAPVTMATFRGGLFKDGVIPIP